MLLRPWIILAALSLARIAFGYQFQTVATIATDLVGRFDLSYARLGGLIGAYNLLGVFAALPLGLLARRFGDRWVLYVGMALMTGGAAYSVWSPTVSALAGAGRSLGWGGRDECAAGQGDRRPVRRPALHDRTQYSDLRVPDRPWPRATGGAAGAGGVRPEGRIADRCGARGSGTDPVVASYRTPAGATAVPRRFSLPSGRECLLVLIGGAVWTVYTAGFSGFASYLPSSLSVRGFGLGATALVMTIVTWGNVPGTLAGGGLAARFGGFNIFLIGSLALSIGMTGSALTNWPIAWAVLLGVGGSIQPGVIMAVGTLSARPENRAVGMGLFYTIYYLGGTFAPALCGVAADFAGRPEGGLLAAAAICLLAIPLYMLHRALASHETMLARA